MKDKWQILQLLFPKLVFLFPQKWMIPDLQNSNTNLTEFALKSEQGVVVSSMTIACRAGVILASKRMPSIFLAKIMAAIFYFNDNGRLRRERNLYQGGERRSRIRRGARLGELTRLSETPTLQATVKTTKML